jgi:alkyl hydroperoxide reductase subunit D
MFTLAASIVGKCHFCVESHYKMLKSAGISVGELKEVGKIAATVVAVANILEAESV